MKKKMKKRKIGRKKKSEEEENEKKEIIEEKRKLIFSYEEIEKSPLKDFVEENDEKILLIDSDIENSDDEFLNRFGNIHENVKEVKKKRNDRYLKSVKLIAKRNLSFEEKKNLYIYYVLILLWINIYIKIMIFKILF